MLSGQIHIHGRAHAKQSVFRVCTYFRNACLCSNEIELTVVATIHLYRKTAKPNPEHSPIKSFYVLITTQYIVY